MNQRELLLFSRACEIHLVLLYMIDDLLAGVYFVLFLDYVREIFMRVFMLQTSLNKKYVLNKCVCLLFLDVSFS